jgi:hypothetical protein
MGTLGTILCIATWTTAFSIGETVDELIGWFDNWSDADAIKRDQEAC